jgi:hypothetical protein
LNPDPVPYAWASANEPENRLLNNCATADETGCTVEDPPTETTVGFPAEPLPGPEKPVKKLKTAKIENTCNNIRKGIW